MALLKLDFQPGINKENTPYSTEGGWDDSDKIRFRAGRPEKIGGWEKAFPTQLDGAVRAIKTWSDLSGTIYTAFATNTKVYVETGGVITDITPLRTTFTSTDTDNCIETDGSTTTVIINLTAHGCEDGAFVTISGAASVGGVPDTELNAEHQIAYIDADSFSITVTTASTSIVAAGGGTSIDVACQINPGTLDGVYQYGWGSGTWSGSTWGTPRSPTIVALYPRTWSMDNWGEDLVMNYTGGGVYLWDATSPTARATQITQAPHRANFILVTKDRHLICFGCNEPGQSNSTSTLDSLQIRWSSQENYTDWTPTATNTAGDFLLVGGVEIIAAAETEAQVMVWTDADLHSMQYLGPPYTFGVQKIGSNAGIVSPNAWVSYGNTVFWMGDGAFYVYDSAATPIPCSVQRFVFSNVNKAQQRKIFAGLNRQFHELSWFYPTETIEDTELNGAITAAATTISVSTTAGYREAGTIKIGNEFIDYTGKTDASFTGCTRGVRSSVATAHDDAAVVSDPDDLECLEPSRYVTFSVIEKSWWIGRISRTAWIDRGAAKFPVAGTRDGLVYFHEKGYNADSEPLVAFIESSDFDLGEGDSLMFISRVIPDFTIESGAVDLKLRTRYYPLSDQVNEIVGSVTTSTTKIDTRIRGRQMALRIESDNADDWWKYGSTRIDQRQDGRR